MTEAFAPSVTALGCVLAFLAAFAMLDLVKRLESRMDGSAFGWLAGASVAFATGLWSAQVVGTDKLDLPYALGYHPGLSVGVWLVAAMFSSLSLAVACRRATAAGRCLVGAGMLATGMVVAEVLFVEALGLRPGITGPGPAVAAAWMVAGLGCGCGLWLHTEVRTRAPRHLMAGQALSALLLASAIVVSQGLVLGGAGLDAQTSSAWRDRVPADSMAVLVTVGSIALLSMLLLLSKLETRWRDSLQRAKGELQTQSLRDPLTELPNRQIFEGTIAQATLRADVSQGRVALLLVNLDGFKPVNESFGHRAGDRVLREIAARLRSLAQTHMVARLGGDEFLLLMPDNPSVEDASGMAARVLASTCLPCRIDGREAIVTGSIGIVMYPQHGALSTLIAHADAAMRVAKGSGGATYCFFEARMVSGLREQTELLRDLRRALAQGELELYYQPKIHAPTGEITGAEALMRWQHPKLGMVSPTLFIPIAERYGLIGSLGNWLIDEVCRQIRVWRDGGLRMRVAINLSVHQLRQPDLVERVGSALRTHDVNPGLLTCEITESVAMEDAEGTIAIFKRLTDLGVSISIDDFGTGHSSLSYLRKLPTSELKIDRSFVLDLETSEDARKVASAVINLAKSLDLKVVAEGVETEGQNKILREFGCDQLQGFLFAKPMSAKALALWAMDDVGPRTMSFRSSLFKETCAAELV
ncbi:MAG: bifunctional diguanylate cyclase/phosphodiesterase [Burkholderiales bacterium PBB1]|nr:MAG: bifunctional diguanylate cyclase/phosphodiesterase [Burkholderiales bacterium PBB1]